MGNDLRNACTCCSPLGAVQQLPSHQAASCCAFLPQARCLSESYLLLVDGPGYSDQARLTGSEPQQSEPSAQHLELCHISGTANANS